MATRFRWLCWGSRHPKTTLCCVKLSSVRKKCWTAWARQVIERPSLYVGYYRVTLNVIKWIKDREALSWRAFTVLIWVLLILQASLWLDITDSWLFLMLYMSQGSKDELVTFTELYFVLYRSQRTLRASLFPTRRDEKPLLCHMT